jgi:NTE family protein
MLTLVLSGAANYGAMQAGALEALFEAGFRPEMIVGTSAGALNAIYLASDPTVEGAKRLRAIWKSVQTGQVGRPNLITGIHRLITKQESLFPSEPLAQFFQGNLPVRVETFGDLADVQGIRAYATAVCLETSRLVTFGDHREDRLLDGAMASTAIPPYFPPWKANGYSYVDGGIFAKLPIRTAVERGATQIIALDVRNALGSYKEVNDIISLGTYALSLMSDHQSKEGIDWAKVNGVPLRLIPLFTPSEVSFWDYTQADYLFELGQKTAQQALEADPLKVPAKWKSHLRQGIIRVVDHLLPTPQITPETTVQPPWPGQSKNLG